MNLILVSGVMRSGSTWAYNVCRILGASAAQSTNQEFGSEYRQGEELDELIPNLHVPAVIVCKTHQTTSGMRSLIIDGIVRNICTLRDPRDCVASRQLFKEETLDESIALVRGTYADAMAYGPQTLRVLYPDILERPEATVTMIAEYLYLGITSDQAAEIAEACRMEAMKQRSEAAPEGGDAATELHQNHVHGGKVGRYLDELSASEQHTVTEALRTEIDWYAALTHHTH